MIRENDEDESEIEELGRDIDQSTPEARVNIEKEEIWKATSLLLPSESKNKGDENNNTMDSIFTTFVGSNDDVYYEIMNSKFPLERDSFYTYFDKKISAKFSIGIMESLSNLYS